MELKVWVEGIKRVVCGVSENTSCQDIVIALAHAMGRTGRFTLIEKWRDNERPLSPSECPLIVLQKWGEFANEVQLCLYESGVKQLKVKPGVDTQQSQDCFSHNFTPPPAKPPEQVIKRSLTFSGPRNSLNTLNHHKSFIPGQLNHRLAPQVIKAPERVTSDGNSWSSSSSLSSQNSTVLPSQPKNASSVSQVSSQDTARSRQSPANHPHPHPHYQQRQTVTHPSNQNHTVADLPNQHRSAGAESSVSQHQHQQQHQQQQQQQQQQQRPVKQASSVSILNVIQNHNSAFQPVRPRQLNGVTENNVPKNGSTSPEVDIPIYSGDIRPKSSHKPAEAEEYDLDSNFPDVVRETGREYLIEEYHVPGKQGQSQGQGHQHGNNQNQNSMEEKERMKMLRLVSVQQERIKMQDSQLSLVDTEILSREESYRELEQKLETVMDDMVRLGGLHDELSRELMDLDGGRLIEEVEQEKQTEKRIKSEIASLQTRLEQCETNLHQFHSKVNTCSEELEKERLVIESDEKRRREEEVKVNSEIAEIQKNLTKQSNETESISKTDQDISKQLEELEKKLEEKKTEFDLLEKNLKEENMKLFQDPMSPQMSKQHELSGEAVLKALEGGLKSPDVNKSRRRVVTSPLPLIISSKNPNGVWV